MRYGYDQCADGAEHKSDAATLARHEGAAHAAPPQAKTIIRP